MLSKLPQEEPIPETSAVNGKLVGMNIVLIVMLGLTGIFLFSTYMTTPQQTPQLYLTNNSTNTTPSTTNMHTNTPVQSSKNAHTSTKQNSKSTIIHSTANQYKSQGDTTNSKGYSNTKGSNSQNTN